MEPQDNPPSREFELENRGNEFIGVAVLALGGMSLFCRDILIAVLKQRLTDAKVFCRAGCQYDKSLAAPIFEVSEWKTAANCILSTLKELEIEKLCGIYRYDFSESYWRKIHGVTIDDFDAIQASIDPQFSFNEAAHLKNLTAYLQTQLTERSKTAVDEK